MKKNTRACLKENLDVLQLWHFPGDRQHNRKHGNFQNCGERLPQAKRKKPRMQPPEMFLNATRHLWSDCNGFLLHSKPRGSSLRHFLRLLWLLDEKEYFLPVSQHYFSKPNQTKIYFLKLIHRQNKNWLVKGCGTLRKVDSLQTHTKTSSVF